MTKSMLQPTSVVPLTKSGIYEFPLRPTEAQARWLQTQYPTSHLVQYFHFPLSRVQIRQVIWRDSLLFSPEFPFGLVAELSGLLEPALEALARYTPGEVIPAEWPLEAPVRAWLHSDSAHIVARPNGDYRVEFAFWSQRPMFHFGHAAARALMFQVDAEVDAESLADELQQVRMELSEVQPCLASYETQARETDAASLTCRVRTRPERCSSRLPVKRL